MYEMLVCKLYVGSYDRQHVCMLLQLHAAAATF